MCRLSRGLSLSSLYNEAISKFYSAQSVSQLIHHLKKQDSVSLSVSLSLISPTFFQMVHCFTVWVTLCCYNTSIFFGVFYCSMVWSTSMACRLLPVTQFHSQVSVLPSFYGKAEVSGHLLHSRQHTHADIATVKMFFSELHHHWKVSLCVWWSRLCWLLSGNSFVIHLRMLTSAASL